MFVKLSSVSLKLNHIFCYHKFRNGGHIHEQYLKFLIWHFRDVEEPRFTDQEQTARPWVCSLLYLSLALCIWNDGFSVTIFILTQLTMLWPHFSDCNYDAQFPLDYIFLGNIVLALLLSCQFLHHENVLQQGFVSIRI